MNIFFDVDYTILAVDGSPRPLILETFRTLYEEGHTLYVWSGMGVRTREVNALGLGPLVSGVFEKPLDRYQARLPRLGIHVWPDFVVDDYSEIVEFFGGMVIRTYMFANSLDREMERVVRVVHDFCQHGTSEEAEYRAASATRPSHGTEPPH
jgi:hypothetical protein